MEEISEIKVAVSAFENNVTQKRLVKRWQQDFELWRLKQYNAGRGYYSYTTNAPRNLANKAISMMTEAKLLIRIPEELLQEKEQETAVNVERFMHGVLTLNDERFMRMPDMPSLKSQMAWHIAIRGSFAIRPYVYKNKKGKTMIDIAVWDMYNVAYGKGATGVSWATSCRTATKSEIKEEYDIEIGKADDEVVDFWDTKNNGVYLKSQGVWAKPLEPHGLDYCPVFIIRSGDQPPVFQENYEYTNVHQGESIFGPNRELYAPINKTMSDWQTIVRRGVKVPLGYWSAGALKTLDQDIYQVEKAAAVQLDSLTNEKIAPLLEPSMPKDAGDLLNMMIADEQRGGISHIAQGELGFRLSGFAINQLQAQLSTIIVPFIVPIERAYTISLLSLAEQYSKGGWQPIEVRGRTSRNQPFGVPKAVKISPSDIDGTWHPEIRLHPTLPKDDAQRYELARLALQGGMLSLDTVQGDLLGIEDTNLEQEKMSREWAKNIPTIKFLDAFEAALTYGDMDGAVSILAEMRKYMMSQMPQGQGQGGEMGLLEKMAAGMPGVGAPGGETGLSPETFPPEQGGGLPGGATNARTTSVGEAV